MKDINSRLLTESIGIRNNLFRLNEQEKKNNFGRTQRKRNSNHKYSVDKPETGVFKELRESQFGLCINRTEKRSGLRWKGLSTRMAS